MENDAPLPEDREGGTYEDPYEDDACDDQYEDDAYVDEEEFGEADETVPVYYERRRAGWGTTIRHIVVVGVLCAFAAMVAAWLLIPVHYTATAWLRIAEEPPHLLYNTGRTDDFLNRKQTAPILITSNFVLNAALRKPGVGQLPSIRDRRDPVSWMKRNVEVSFPGDSEILQIAMTGRDPMQLVTLVNAVMNAYMEEVVAVDREESLRRKRLLDQSYQRNMEQIKKKQYLYKELANQIGVAESEEARQRQIHSLATLPELRARVKGLRSQIRELDLAIAMDRARLEKLDDATESADPLEVDEAAVLRAAEAAVAEDSRIDQAARQIEVLEAALFEESLRTDDESPSRAAEYEARLSTLRSTLEKWRQELLPDAIEEARRTVAAASGGGPGSSHERITGRIEDAEIQKAVLEEELRAAMADFKEAAREAEGEGVYSYELESRKVELERLKRITAHMGEELEQREIELAAPERVKVLEKANVPRENDVDKKIRQVTWLGVGVFLAVCVFGISIAVVRRRTGRTWEQPYENETPAG